MRVIHNLDALAADLEEIAVQTPVKLRRVIEKNVAEGNKIGQSFAKESSGTHGKWYPKAFTAEMTGPLVGEYGPDAMQMQGGMSFERGSRNQPPHLDVLKSADLITPKFHADVDDVLDGNSP
jgi:hypothetical protein